MASPSVERKSEMGVDREEARAEYKNILAGVIRHHQAMERNVTDAAFARIARRLGLRVKGGVIDADDEEMALVSDLALYGRVAGLSRAIDRYAHSASHSLDAFDRELLEAMRRSWFSILRLTSRHPAAGWYVDDLRLGRTKLWLMNEGIKRSGQVGLGLGARVFEFQGFLLLTGGAAPLTPEIMDELDDIQQAQEEG